MVAAGTAALIGGGLSAAGSVGSSLIGSSGAQSAANTQQQALQQMQALEQPYVQAGYGAANQLSSDLSSGAMGQPFNLTQQQLAATPGYQWALQQGLESTQNAAAGRGLGVSGAALKGAAQFATGLASQTYQQQFQDYWANQMNRYSMLSGLSGIGANAAAGVASNLMTGAGYIGNAQQQQANLLGGGLTGATGSLTNANFLNALIGNSGGTTYAPAATSGQVFPGGFVAQ